MCNDSDALCNHHDSKLADSSPTVTTASARKREQLVAFIDRKMAPHAAVRAVAVFGSVATGIRGPPNTAGGSTSTSAEPISNAATDGRHVEATGRSKRR